MISAGDFRNGITFELDGQVYQVVEFQHVKPGKGAAFVRTKIKNVITGTILEKSFNPSDKMPRAHIERKDMQYLYSDNGLYYFMDMETYESCLSMKKRCFEIRQKTTHARFFPTRAMFSVLNLNVVELEVISTEPDSRATLLQEQQNPPVKPMLKSKCHFSLKMVT